MSEVTVSEVDLLDVAAADTGLVTEGPRIPEALWSMPVSLIERIIERSQSDDVFVEILATDGEPTLWTYRQLIGAAMVMASELSACSSERGRPIKAGLLAENSAQWVVADLAMLLAGVVEVPVPTAFSSAQARSLLGDVDICVVDRPGSRRLGEWAAVGPEQSAEVLAADCEIWKVDLPALCEMANRWDVQWSAADRAVFVDGDPVVKVVHTSGTTSAPKGVKIRLRGIEALLGSLDARTSPEMFGRYLSIVPMSLLIEQVAGLYMTLLGGGRLAFFPSDTSLVGTSADAGKRMIDLVRKAQPTAMVVPPVFAALILGLCDQHPQDTSEACHRRIFGHDGPVFIASGGAPVSVEVLEGLDKYGISIYEGYGLSENSSVVSWNFPGQRKVGTVGKPLEHVEVRLAADGELLIRSSSLFAGYTQEDPSSVHVDEEGWLFTGDLAEIDADGYLRISGRKKSIVITASGRNLSPEWVESRYRELEFVRESAIIADGLESVIGLFVVDPEQDPLELRRAIEEFGKIELSEVERAADIRLMAADDPAYLECFTMTGRPRRDVIRDRILGAGILPIPMMVAAP